MIKYSSSSGDTEIGNIESCKSNQGHAYKIYNMFGIKTCSAFSLFKIAIITPQYTESLYTGDKEEESRVTIVLLNASYDPLPLRGIERRLGNSSSALDITAIVTEIGNFRFDRKLVLF